MSVPKNKTCSCTHTHRHSSLSGSIVVFYLHVLNDTLLGMGCTYLIVKDLDAPEVNGVAVTVRGLALGQALEDLEILLVQGNVLEVGDDARLGHRLGDDTGTTLGTPGNQDVGVRAVVLLSDLGDLFWTGAKRKKEGKRVQVGMSRCRWKNDFFSG